MKVLLPRKLTYIPRNSFVEETPFGGGGATYWVPSVTSQARGKEVGSEPGFHQDTGETNRIWLLNLFLTTNSWARGGAY